MTITSLNQSSAGAPSLTGAAGALIAVLDYCLVTHLGWSKDYSGTNTASYRPATGNRFYLGVDDSSTLNARLRGFETMTAQGVAVASGSGPFPTDAQVSGGRYFYKSSDTSTTRNWSFISDGACFYFRSYAYGGSSNSFFNFGDFVSYAVADAYATTIGAPSVATSFDGLLAQNLPTGVISYPYENIARTSSGIGGSVFAAKLVPAYHLANNCIGSVATGISLPSSIDGATYLQRVLVGESSGPRGHFPGLWATAHGPTAFADGDTFSGTGDLSGRSFVAWVSSTGVASSIVIETSDTWRT